MSLVGLHSFNALYFQCAHLDKLLSQISCCALEVFTHLFDDLYQFRDSSRVQGVIIGVVAFSS